MNFFLAQQETGFSEEAFAKFWNFPRSDFHGCPNITQNPLSTSFDLVWKREFGGHELSDEASILSRLEKAILDLPPECDIGPTVRTAWLQGRPTPGSQAISLPSLFLAGFLSVLGLGMLQAQGVEHFCPSDILWRLPQEKEGASRQESGSHFQVAPRDTERRGGREIKTWMDGAEVSKASGDPASQSPLLQYLLVFPLPGERLA